MTKWKSRKMHPKNLDFQAGLARAIRRRVLRLSGSTGHAVAAGDDSNNLMYAMRHLRTNDVGGVLALRRYSMALSNNADGRVCFLWLPCAAANGVRKAALLLRYLSTEVRSVQAAAPTTIPFGWHRDRVLATGASGPTLRPRPATGEGLLDGVLHGRSWRRLQPTQRRMLGPWRA